MLPEMKAGGCLSSVSKDGMELPKHTREDVNWVRKLADPVPFQEGSSVFSLVKTVLTLFEVRPASLHCDRLPKRWQHIKLLDNKNKKIAAWHPCSAGNNNSAADSESPSKIGPYGVWVLFSALLKLGMHEEDILDVFQVSRPKKGHIKAEKVSPTSPTRVKESPQVTTHHRRSFFLFPSQESSDAEAKFKDELQEEGLTAEVRERILCSSCRGGSDGVGQVIEGLVLAVSTIIDKGSLPDHVQQFFTDLSSVHASDARGASGSLRDETAVSP
eukprot:768723-Hanusia_phi.AAC.1